MQLINFFSNKDRQDEVEERFGRIFQLFLKELLKR